MSKNVKKTLAAALTVATATGSMSIPAFAAENNNKTNVDDLYKAAYEATVKTQDLDTVTQADVNAAREAIAALKETSAADAIPTFSAIVDKAQQKFLETSYNLIVKCQKTEDQKDINAARASIQNLPAEFKNPYSMAIDVVQQKKIDIVYAAVQEAIKTQKKADVEKAQNLIDDLKTVVDNDGVKDWVNKLEVTFKDATKTLDVVSANAQNNQEIQIVFNRPVDAKTVKADNFAVAAKDGDSLPVGAVKVSEDGMTATIKVLTNLKDKENYTVTVTGIKDTFGNDIAKDAKASFDYEIAAVKSIEFTSTDVPTSANLKNYVVIKDAKGRDVTNQYKNKLTFTASNNLVDINGSDAITAGKVTQGNNKVIVEVVVDGTNIKTSKTLTITDSAATQFDGYAIVNTNCDLKGKTLSTLPASDKLSYVTVGQKDAKVVFGYKDVHGNELELTNTAKVVVEENYNPEIATMNNNGVITALSQGTAYFRVKYGDIERTISIQVNAASVPSTIATSSDSYNLVATNKSGINISYAINNQYGAKYNGNTEVLSYPEYPATGNETVDSSALKDSQKITGVIVKNANGEVINNKLTVTPNAKKGEVNIKPAKDESLATGTYTVTLERKFKFKGEKTTVDKTITINVVNGGELSGYKVQIDHTTLNMSPNDNNTDGVPQNAKLTVYEMDAQGNELGIAKDSKVTILDSEGNEVVNSDNKLNADQNNNGVWTLKALDDGTYTVQVKVNSLMIKQVTVKVIKTESKVSAIQFNGTSTVLNNYENNALTIGNLFGKDYLNAEVKDQYGNNVKDATITGVNYTIANRSGVKINKANGTNPQPIDSTIEFTGKNNNGVPVSQGKFDLVISSITANGETIYYNTPKVIKVTVNPKTTVTPEMVNTALKTVNVNDRSNIKDITSEQLGTFNFQDKYGNIDKNVKVKLNEKCISIADRNVSQNTIYFNAKGEDISEENDVANYPNLNIPKEAEASYARGTFNLVNKATKGIVKVQINKVIYNGSYVNLTTPLTLTVNVAPVTK